MEKIDPQQAAQVWQRVRADNPVHAPAQGLAELIAQKLTHAATYLQLSRRFQGKESAILRKMYEQEQSHAACLKGIYTLLTGTPTVIRTVDPGQDTIENTLRRCYGAEMRCLARYEERSSDAEYGPVFRRLAEQEREHCMLILVLLGNLKKRP